MENPTSPLLTWPYYHQHKVINMESLEDLRHSLFYTTLELESSKIVAQEEIRKKEEELGYFQELLNKAISERDDAQEKYRELLLEKQLMQQNSASPGVNSSISSIIEDEPFIRKDGFSLLEDCEESIVSSSSRLGAELVLTARKPLPEKGKLLQAVMKAGPLLETLLLAGPLPQWKHPPPSLEMFEIPPVMIPASSFGEEILINESNCGDVDHVVVNRKRSFLGSSPQTNKCQRLLLH